MRIQLALDFITVPEAKALLAEIGDIVDIVEIGTPFVIDEGIQAVREIRDAFPGLTILADLKIMDAGEHETQSAIDAGADIVTVLGVASDATIRACVETAGKACKEIMVDMIGVPDMEARTIEVDRLGVDYICVHTAFDVQATGKNPLEELQLLRRVVKNAGAAVAGGVKIATLPDIVREGPDIVVVGGGITGQADRRAAALKMKEIMG